MDIADTFTDSLARLTGDEQKAAKTTAFDLQLNPANPGMSLHKLDRARDKHFWSVAVNSDLRLIVHKSPGSRLHKAHLGPVTLATSEVIGELLQNASQEIGGHKFTLHFLRSEGKGNRVTHWSALVCVDLVRKVLC